MRKSNRIRIVILNLPVAGLLFVVGMVLRGAYVDPSKNPDAFAQAANASNFQYGWYFILVGLALEIFGYVALYNYLADRPVARLAYVALAFGVAGIALALPLSGFMTFAAPTIGTLYVSGLKQVIDVAISGLTSPLSLLVSIPSGIFYTLGSVLFGIAIWQSGVLPRWSGVMLAIQAPLVSFASLVSFQVEILGAVLLLVSGAWISWAVWQQMTGQIAQNAKPTILSQDYT